MRRGNNALIDGMSRSFDMFGVFRSVRTSDLNHSLSDRLALQGDWVRIGNDIRNAWRNEN